MAKIVSINISQRKGIAKSPVKEGVLREDYGLEGDVHSGPGDRQVSLLAIESIQRQQLLMDKKHIDKCPKTHSQGIKLKPGDFAENITTEGIELAKLNLGDVLKIGEGVELQISKIGKECHRFCSIYYKTGDCIMPREGIFAKVLRAGKIKNGEEIQLLK